MFMNYKLICLLGSIFSGFTGFAQHLNFQNVAPATPEVAAFAKNVDIPMSYSSGTPQIGIPFYSVSLGSLSVPVSLSYNASGIRVEEAATWTGLGWNLSTGPTLTRAVRGLPDDNAYGYIHMPVNRTVKYLVALPNICEERYQIESYELPNNFADFQPDIFSFSAMGYSGQFYWNQDSSKFILSPYQNIKIECPLGMSGIADFILTLPNGVKCHFGGGGGCNCKESFQYSSTTNVLNGYEQSPVTNSSPYISSWAIKEISDPTGKLIEYFYTMEYSVREFGRGGEVKKMALNSTPGDYTLSFYKNDFDKPILNYISGDNCDIYFKRSSSARQDVVNLGKSLDTIVIKTKNGVEVKSFLFDYGYFTSSDSISLWGLSEYTGIARKRIYLKSVTEKNTTASLALPPYEFTYSNIALPNRLSSSQDYWGYYNGKNNGNFLMPRIPIKNLMAGIPNPNLPSGYIAGADRRIDANYTQAGMLTKIKYPTGGTTSYTYEPNTSIVNMYFNTNVAIERPDLVDKSYTFEGLQTPDPPYPHYFMDTFRITLPQTKVKITPDLPSPCDPYNSSSSCLFTIKIKSLPDSATQITINTTSPFYADLPQSLYKIEAFVTGSTDDPVENFTVHLEWGEGPDAANFLVGGLRAKKIISGDSSGKTISKSFDYKWGGDSSIYSSGVLMGLPMHLANYYDTSANIIGYNYVSNSNVPLTSDGQTVRYQFVTEYYDSSKSSFKFQYDFVGDMPEIVFCGRSDAPSLLKNWLNNILFRKRAYELTGSTYRILTDEWNYYTSYSQLEHLYGVTGVYYRPYYVATEWYVPTSTENISYSYPNSQTLSLQTTSQNYYNAKFQLANTRATNSKGQVIDKKIWYPDDYNNVSGYNLDLLKDKNIIDIPIKQETSVNGKIRSGAITKYSPNGLPVNIYAYENSTLADTVEHARNTVLESNYNLKTTASYDINSNLKQVNNTNNITSTYIWDHQINGFTGAPMNMFPIAVIQNADSSSVAYTSFENSSTGNWSFNSGYIVSTSTGLTGKNYYNQTGFSISRSSLSSSNVYIITYWSKNGSYTISGTQSGWPKTVGSATVGGQAWTCYEHKVTGQTTITVSGTGAIDELRLYPEKAQMTSYSYTPLFQPASVCDANNHISFYEYDALNRLSLLRDQDNNILKKICYNYAGQAMDCGYGTSAAWQAISSSCEQTSGSNNGNMVVIEKDLNPSSATYNQTRSVVLESAGTCPVCNTTICTGNDKKCINNICETGVRINTGSVRINSTTWRCYYHYTWSDSSVSSTYDELGSASACIIN
ncbi:MAG: hypothetical protein JWN83_2063 [Chitinophagaceae bacterium]|nr:hypothetical protein [Chitinophagaceae bacterium]